MKLAFAWRSLMHNKARAVVTIAGVSLSILLIFIQLGLYDSIFRTATMVQDGLNFDIALVSPSYVFLAKPGTFPRRRVVQAQAVHGVENAVPLYTGIKRWRNPQTRKEWRIFILAFNPRDHVFALPEIEQQRAALETPDAVLLDRQTRPEFGPQEEGQHIELDTRTIEISGRYTLGTGFLSNGALLTSDQSFSRMFNGYPLENVNMALVTLQPGANTDDTAQALRQSLAPDVRVLTRAELDAHEKHYWAVQSSVGLIFGFGAAVAVLVGSIILYQILATDVIRHLPEYATLKALGYKEETLAFLVLIKATLLGLIAFAPAAPVALLVYAVTRDAAKLPVFMTWQRVLAVLVLTLGMGVISGVSSARKLLSADPADLY